MRSVLFVCLGNICRSPLAEGIFRHLIAKDGTMTDLDIDSAGNGAWHEGNPPDRRAISIAAKHGIDISKQRSRPVETNDFHEFDLILGMDDQNLIRLRDIEPPRHEAKVDLFLSYTTGYEKPVEDPYYGGPEGFQQVFEELYEANQKLVEKLKVSS